MLYSVIIACIALLIACCVVGIHQIFFEYENFDNCILADVQDGSLRFSKRLNRASVISRSVLARFQIDFHRCVRLVST